MSSDRQLLRHTLATLAYRCGKTLRDAPGGFADFRTRETVNTPLKLISHIADLLEWTLTSVKGQTKYNDSTPSTWQDETRRFYTALQSLDDYLASNEPLHTSTEKLFQGPIADALTHTGQLALLRRMAGAPIRGESYFVADIVRGRVGSEQSKGIREFD
jgi:hypothetical protein